MKHIDDNIILKLLDGTQDGEIQEHINNCDDCYVKFYAAKARYLDAQEVYINEEEIEEAKARTAIEFDFLEPIPIPDSAIKDPVEQWGQPPYNKSEINIETLSKSSNIDSKGLIATVLNSNFLSLMTAASVLLFIFYMNIFTINNQSSQIFKTYDFRVHGVTTNDTFNNVKHQTRSSTFDLDEVKIPEHAVMQRDFSNYTIDQILEFSKSRNLCIHISQGDIFKQTPSINTSFNPVSDTLFIIYPKK